MSTEVLYNLMSNQRAIRRLKPDPIPDDVLGRIMQAAAWAPTGGNLQPWRMLMVHDRAQKERLGELYTVHWNNFTARYRQRFVDAPRQGDRRKSAQSPLATTWPRTLAIVRSWRWFASTPTSWPSPMLPGPRIGGRRWFRIYRGAEPDARLARRRAWDAC